MSKFDDYNSSQIIPQRTLLEKFNKVIKFLSDNPTYNLFLSSENYINTGTVYDKTLIQDKKHEIEVGDLVLFNNVYIGVISMVGELTYSISKAIYFKGAKGDKGDSGNSFKIIGTVNSTADLPATAPYGTAYFVGVIPPRNVYVFDSLTNSWINQGQLQASITVQEIAQRMVGDNYISIVYYQDTNQIKFTFNDNVYYDKNAIDNLISLIYDEINNEVDLIDDEIDNVRAVAEGKCKSYVINNLNDITGTKDSDDNFTNVTSITGVELTNLKIGDVILIKELDVADYWVSKISPTVELNKMEVSKIDLLNGIYPVGSIYMSVVNSNPSILFGGTWEQLKDRFLLGSGDIYTNGATGGEATHTLTKQEMPIHDHFMISSRQYSSSAGGSNNPAYGSGTNANNDTTSQEGGGQPHNNMPPYLVVYMWKRTA